MVMTRHWYSASPVADGHSLLDEPGFWPAYLADLAGEITPEAFGSDAGDTNAMLDTLHDPSAWPMFTVPLADGFAIVVHFNSGEEFTTTDYFLTHPDWSQDLVLASDDQDRIGPGLCWPELAALLEAPPSAAGVTDSLARLLLLLPVLGDAAVPDEAVTAVVRALIAQGAPESSEALAGHLLQGHPMWGAEDWWFDDDEQSWLCEGEHSPRKVPLGDHLPPQQRAALEACLTPR
ncbi:hypothetical protein [Streptomyces sp. SAI-149]|uniref:hypothetical protein n=1 Tax=Streptomyces sp. SAI-149 TaxID=2940542 RepID=UPI0024768677|nr:hypothetical protein [Streptomyces sp. SAI-149]MDH6493971.1 hypothetical protein [Streptomyces sp. SAI-149]